MSLSDDLYRWRSVLEQALDAQKVFAEAAKENDFPARSAYPDRDYVDEYLLAYDRLEKLADELFERYVGELRAEGRRTTETTPRGPGIATRKGAPDGEDA